MLLVNGTCLTLGETPRIIQGGALRIVDGVITDIGTSLELTDNYPEEEQLDAGGRLMLPGLVCAHTHFYGLFARGLSLGEPAPQCFEEILEKLWWRLDRSLLMEDTYYSALVCLVDAIRNGTTTLIDHHASPGAIPHSLDAIAQAVSEAGVRCSLCYEVSDRDGPEIARAGLEENARFLSETRGKDLVAGAFGLHASMTLSDSTLGAAVEMAEGLGAALHIHVAEGEADVRDSVRKYGKRVVRRLADLHVLGPKTVAAHCVHVNDEELLLLRDTGTRVVHNPRSNMNNAVGVAPVPEMLSARIEVGLGNDGFSNNMFTEMKTAYLLHKHAQRDPRVMGAGQVVQIAVCNNSATARIFFPRVLGELAPGGAADVILLDYWPPTPLTAENLPWHLIFGMDGGQVSTTIVGGKVLMHNRELQTLDEERICAKARELAAAAWKRV